MLYERIFKQFNSNHLKYLVIGGVAVNLHGFSRATADLDILISLDDENIRNFIQSAKSLNLTPRVPVKIEEFADEFKRDLWIKEKNMKVFTLLNSKDPMEQVDVVLEDYIDFDKAYNNRETLAASGIKIPLISIDDLIKLKMIADRERDTIDINALKEIKELKNDE